jgi:BCD family chlorophyll transporter-like MFS transporter
MSDTIVATGRAGTARRVFAEARWWGNIARLGLVQAAIGAVVVLMTSTLNRVMVVELGLVAAIPGTLVGIHFAVQILRPRMGFGSDRDGRRIRWIVGGMALTSASGLLAAVATAWMTVAPTRGLLLALGAFFLLGIGISASSTPFLAYLAERVEEPRMAGAAALTWILMIVGIIVTAAVAGALLDPYSPTRLVQVAAGVTIGAFVLTLFAVVGRSGSRPIHLREDAKTKGAFREVLGAMWADPKSRAFAMFIFVSMLAYSAQDIILEPFAGAVFGMTPGESTALAGVQHGGVLIGMIAGAVLAARVWTLTRWAAAGCLGSAAALLGIVMIPATAPVELLKGTVFALGFANGIFAVAAIGAMMGLTVKGKAGGAGLRMGFWGAAQAIAYGTGGLLGAVGSDIGRELLGSAAAGYSVVFTVEAVLFVAAAVLVVATVRDEEPARSRDSLLQAGKAMAAS